MDDGQTPPNLPPGDPKWHLVIRESRRETDSQEGITLGQAAEAFLHRRDLDADTLRSYGQTLARLRAALGDGVLLSDLTAEHAAAVFTETWAQAAPPTWNRHRAALRSFTTWTAPRWGTPDVTTLIERRKEDSDATKVIDRHLIEALWQRRYLPLRDKALFRLLYESAARSVEVLGLDVGDLLLEAKRGRVRRKGGSTDWILWQSGTARLLPRLLAGRSRGPVFLTDRRPGPARTPAGADLCPVTGRARLSYERAEYLFKQATKSIDPTGTGYTLHQLRHSRLTHLGEDGWSSSMLMALSGHRNLRTLGIYVQPSAEAVAAALAEHDPGRRHREEDLGLCYVEEPHQGSGMVDHLRGRYRDKKLIAFTLEPYHEVDADAFRAASQALAEDDLVMSVCSCCAVHYPGQTLAIIITRKEDGQPIHLINHF